MTAKNCIFHGEYLAFELAGIEADIVGDVLSIPGPLSGTITYDGAGKIINVMTGYDCKGKVIIKQKLNIYCEFFYLYNKNVGLPVQHFYYIL